MRLDGIRIGTRFGIGIGWQPVSGSCLSGPYLYLVANYLAMASLCYLNEALKSPNPLDHLVFFLLARLVYNI